MQVQHVSTGEKKPTDHLQLLPDPQQHTRDSTPHAADFSLPTVSEPSCSYRHTTTERKYAVKDAISESCKHSGRAEAKQRQFRFCQTVNHAKVIWDSKTKPKGIVGGHLNIQSIISKQDQVQHLFTVSNLDYLCLTETWLKCYIPTHMLDVPGYVCFRKDR